MHFKETSLKHYTASHFAKKTCFLQTTKQNKGVNIKYVKQLIANMSNQRCVW